MGRECTYPDLTSRARRGTAEELLIHSGSTEVGSHGEVGDCRGGQDNDTDLVEESGASLPLSTWSAAVVRMQKKDVMRTENDQAIIARSQMAMTAKTAHSQSEPPAVMWRNALGALVLREELPMSWTSLRGRGRIEREREDREEEGRSGGRGKIEREREDREGEGGSLEIGRGTLAMLGWQTWGFI